MNSFKPIEIDRDHEDDLRADARSAMFFALRSAFKKRADEYNFRAKDLAEAMRKDKGYVSRVLNGTSGSIDFETLIVFLEALGFHLPLDPVSIEDLKHKKVNFDARPSGIDFDVDTNQTSITVASNNIKYRHKLTVGYEALSNTTSSVDGVVNKIKFKPTAGAQ